MTEPNPTYSILEVIESMTNKLAWFHTDDCCTFCDNFGVHGCEVRYEHLIENFKHGFCTFSLNREYQIAE